MASFLMSKRGPKRKREFSRDDDEGLEKKSGPLSQCMHVCCVTLYLLHVCVFCNYAACTWGVKSSQQQLSHSGGVKCITLAEQNAPEQLKSCIQYKNTHIRGEEWQNADCIGVLNFIQSQIFNLMKELPILNNARISVNLSKYRTGVKFPQNLTKHWFASLVIHPHFQLWIIEAKREILQINSRWPGVFHSIFTQQFSLSE